MHIRMHKLCVVGQEENKLILFSFQIAVFVAYVAKHQTLQ